MARAILVTHTASRREPVERARARLAPARHVEIHDRFSYPQAGGIADVLAPRERERIRTEAQRWLKALPSRSVSGQPFGGWLLEGGVSAWWWMESPLWFGEPRAPLAPPLPDLLEGVEAVRSALEADAFDVLAFAADGPCLARLAMEDLAAASGVAFRATGPATKGSRMRDALRPAAIRHLLLRRRKAAPRVEPRPVEVLMVSHTNALRLVGGQERDVYLGPLAAELSRRGVRAATCYVNVGADANPRARPSAVRIPDDGFLLEQSLGTAPAAAVPDGLGRLAKSWDAIRATLVEGLAWRGVPMPRTFGTWFTRLLHRHAPTAIYYAAAFDELFRAWRPRVAVVTNETGYAGRAATAAAHRHGARSMGVQHGLIGPHHVEYVHPPEALDPSNPWRCPIPDVTALDGHYYRRVLLESSSYPADALVVTGQMRYEAYGGPAASGRKRGRRILVVTQPLPGMDAWAAQVLRAANGLGEIVVKAHPLEEPAAYEATARAEGVAATVVRDADLPDLLATSAVLVARSSTTIVEAAVLGCPTVVFNPTGVPDPVPFAQLGGGKPAATVEELRAVLEDVAAGGPVVAQLASSRAAFLEEFAFGLGKGASGRVADVALRLARA